MSAQWKVNRDGSFDLVTPGPRLWDCFPAFDGSAVHPLEVQFRSTREETEITYSLRRGEFAVRLWMDAGTPVLSSSVVDLEEAPRRVHPCSGHVSGADRLFRQGLGFAGPSGFVDVAASGEPFSHQSHLVTGLCGREGDMLAVVALDHGRFPQKSVLRNRVERCGLVNRGVSADDALFEAGFATEGVPLHGRELALPDLRFLHGEEPWSVAREAARQIGRAMDARTDAPPRYHWCSWYYASHSLTAERLRKWLAEFQKLDPPVPLQAVQIDAGYYTHAGDWLEPNHRWPGGMEQAFGIIREAGYEPGIWVAPFMVGNRSRLYAEHPEWILRDAEGEPVTEWRFYGPRRMWGQRDEEYYVLDTSHPAAHGYLRRVFRTLHDWGARFFKTDFMDWGLKDSADVRRHNPGKTSVEYFRELLDTIRGEIGEESYWLACISPFAPFIGYADGMRVANDNGVAWSEGSTGNMLRETAADQYFNNVWWQNDSDVVYLRDFHIDLTGREVRSLGFWQGILGAGVNTSAPLHRLSPERLRLWRFLRPGAERLSARLPGWCGRGKLMVAVRPYSQLGSHAVLALNPLDEPVTERLEFSELIGRERAFCYAWGPEGHDVLGEWSFVTPQLAPHESVLYYLAPDESPPPGDLSLGGSREFGNGGER